MPTPELIAVGSIARPHGLKGEVKINVWSDHPDRFRRLERVWVETLVQPPVAHVIEQVRGQDTAIILKLAGINSREVAERLRNARLCIPREECLPPPEGAFYVFDLVGLSAVTDKGEALGQIADVLLFPANDVYVVQGETGEILLPAIQEVIKEIDLESRRVTVHLMEGLVQ